MNWFTKTALVVTIAATALLGGYLLHAWIDVPAADAPDAGAALFAATLDDHDGRPQAIAQWKGKVVVVNFWATWCGPCIKEIPELVRIQQTFGERGVQIVGVAIDDREKVAAFARKMGINYPSLVAEAEGLSLARRAGNRLGGLPFTVVLDRAGRTVRVELGAVDANKLEPVLRPLL